ncbi:hypothetical protein NECAME_03980 [Necator americanus]|uniref:Uncharacterized protein n=1 Tax=Necator americanus TaxID=51031 RepID=W2SXK3_NECAM|nr:hypothetical protein NECAME_03980 [Necator americanus]ETN74494.1 hypothetical protein NECAME_03980 [Necator americanus]
MPEKEKVDIATSRIQRCIHKHTLAEAGGRTGFKRLGGGGGGGSCSTAEIRGRRGGGGGGMSLHGG